MMPTSQGCRKNADGNHAARAVRRRGGGEAPAVADPRESTLRPPSEPAPSPPRRARCPARSPLTSYWGRRPRLSGRPTLPRGQGPALRGSAGARRGGNEAEGTVTRRGGQDAALPFSAGTVAAPVAAAEQPERPVNAEGARSVASRRAGALQRRKTTSAGNGDGRQELPHASRPPASDSAVRGAGGWETRPSPRATVLPATSVARRFLMTGQGGLALSRCKPGASLAHLGNCSPGPAHSSLPWWAFAGTWGSPSSGRRRGHESNVVYAMH